jgi:hypothetical protein
MRRHVILLTVLYALNVDSPRPAEAGTFATEFTQLLNHANSSCSTSSRASNWPMS